MSWAAVAGAAVGVVGGALSSSSKGGQGSQTTQNTVDPRIAQYLYGASGQGGLLSGVNNTYMQQAAQGGLNPMQNAGLEMQRQTLMSPQYTQGFDQMRNLGAGLMGQGVAGNPFTGGGRANGMPNLSPNLGFNSTSAPAFQQVMPQASAPQASITPQDMQALLQQQQQQQMRTTQPVQDDFRLSAGQ